MVQVQMFKDTKTIVVGVNAEIVDRDGFGYIELSQEQAVRLMDNINKAVQAAEETP